VSDRDTIWNVPEGYHTQIEEAMFKVTYLNCAFDGSAIMGTDDKYNETNAKTKIHNVSGKYFQFKFPGDSFNLPSADIV
jgi:hypothetical protein